MYVCVCVNVDKLKYNPKWNRSTNNRAAHSIISETKKRTEEKRIEK